MTPTDSERVRLAVVGVGWAGSRQVAAIRELGGQVDLACLVDTDPVHLAERAAALHVHHTLPSLRDALADATIDAVSLCTPHRLHAEQAVAAAAAGKHVLVEKPIAMTVAEAGRMMDAAAANGVTLYVAENQPYTSQSHFLRAQATNGAIVGELTFVTVTAGFRAPQYGYPGRRAWLASPEAGGTWTLHGIHTVAQLRSILCPRYGEVETVWMCEHKASSFRRTDLEGSMSGLLTLESGLCIHITQTAETDLPDSLGGITLYGDRATLHAGKNGYRIFDGREDKMPPLLAYPPESLSDYAQEIEAFAHAVHSAAGGLTSAASERRTLAVVQAGYESARSGQPVSLSRRFGPI